MTLEDIEVASVGLLGKKKLLIPVSLSFSVSLFLFLKCLIRDEKYWPAFYFTNSFTRYFQGAVLSHSLILHSYIIRKTNLEPCVRKDKDLI